MKALDRKLLRDLWRLRSQVLTIALVVAVIFVFLRNLWATIIPSITVPLCVSTTTTW